MTGIVPQSIADNVGAGHRRDMEAERPVLPMAMVAVEEPTLEHAVRMFQQEREARRNVYAHW